MPRSITPFALSLLVVGCALFGATALRGRAARASSVQASDPTSSDPTSLDPVSPDPDPSSPDPRLLQRARAARDCAARKGLLDPSVSHKLALIDFRRPSSARRLWVLDERSGAVLLHERVAHGKNTGEDQAVAFSDEPGSLQSSLGLYVAAEPYLGKHGESLRLDGLEPGLNARARERAIVVHGAEYATEAFVAEHGRLGRSFGCPAVAPEVIAPLIEAIAHGTPLFAWTADSDWDSLSVLAECAGG